MLDLKVSLLGPFTSLLDEIPLPGFRTKAVQALLIYLLCEPETAHQRESLMTLLWPDLPQKSAQNNLRQTLYLLKKAVPKMQAKTLDDTVPLLLIDRHTVQLNPEAEIVLDVDRFESILAGPKTEWPMAINLYRGHFLSDFYLPESASFEAWVLARREVLRRQFLVALEQLATEALTVNELQTAERFARRQVDIDNLHEGGHRLLMQALAAAGRRTEALSQYKGLRELLAEELGAEPSAETDELYNQILADDFNLKEEASNTVLQPATAVNQIPFQAPAVSPHFVGRTEELALLSDLLLDTNDSLKLVSLVGMGGIGKTSLATLKAHELKAHFADGVLWSNLMVSAPATILDVWAKAYGRDFSSIADLESKSSAVRGLLADKETLIVLDNAENAADVRPLLPNNGRCAVLLTTRNLDIASALNAHVIPMQELTAVDGLDLLIQILGAERINRTPAETIEAKRISTLLQHLPLAVEIAAQRLKSRPRMSLAALASRLEHTQQRLALEISDRAVRTSFQVSWEGLTPPAQHVFKAISIFQGRPFIAESIAHITNINLFDTEDEIHTLSTLSMLQEEGENRYQQHTLLADFGFEKLNNEERNALTTRMIAYYLEFAKTDQQNINRLEREAENLDLAIEKAHSLAMHQELVAFTDYLSKAWKALGHYSQARNAYALVNEVTQNLNDRQRSTINFLRWGEACLEQNDYEEALHMLQQALALSTQLNDLNGIAQANYLLARIAILQNQNEQARTLLMTCNQYFDQLNDQQGKANVLFQQGYIALTDREAEKAQSCFESSLKIYQEIRDHVGEIDTLRMLAHNELEQRNYYAAQKFAIQAKTASERTREKALYTSTLYLLTGIYTKQKNFDLAQAVGEECLPLLRQTGRQRTEGLLLRQLSLIQKEGDNYENALAFAKQSSAIFQALNDHKANIVALRQMGDIYLLLQQPQSAADVWQTALGFAKQIQSELLIKTLNQRLN